MFNWFLSSFNVIIQGYRANQVDECLEEYEELNVWQRNAQKTRITFV
jgi:hypothetical protein